MKPEKTKQALTRLFGLLTSDGTKAEQFPGYMYRMRLYSTVVRDAVVEHDASQLRLLRSHCAWMCTEATTFVDEGRTEKAMRWLGYIGAVAQIFGLLTLDELKDLYKPEAS